MLLFFHPNIRPVGFTKLVLPSPEEAPKLYNLTAVLVLLFAVSWPFMASRGAIDLATLALIYIMLGLGLNVVVGRRVMPV